jgi:hypothetical protein
VIADAVLEPTKQAVRYTKKMLDDAGITEQRAAMFEVAGQAFITLPVLPCGIYALQQPAATSPGF